MCNVQCNINGMILISDFFNLIYPRLCLACGHSLFSNEKTICTSCLYHLPGTDFHKDKNNPVSQVFWGKVKLEAAAAYYFYSKGGKVRHLIHSLKYDGKKEIGIYIGKLYGMDLCSCPPFEDVDVIVPVPLHSKKLRKRGFNQSEMFARGIAISMNVKVDTKILFRSIASQTQTRKTRFNRWKNVENIFDIRKAGSLKDKHILLVDDVITTGSTIESCVHALEKIPFVRISVVAMAFASN